MNVTQKLRAIILVIIIFTHVIDWWIKHWLARHCTLVCILIANTILILNHLLVTHDLVWHVRTTITLQA